MKLGVAMAFSQHTAGIAASQKGGCVEERISGDNLLRIKCRADLIHVVTVNLVDIPTKGFIKHNVLGC